MKMTGIAAVDTEWGIGLDNTIPWKCSEDLKHFKNTTKNKLCIMGRKTYESMTPFFKGEEFLPNRFVLVLTSKREPPKYKNVVFCDINIENYTKEDLPQKIQQIQDFFETDNMNRSEIMICGGSKIYSLFFDFYDELLITKINGVHDCNVFFPDLRLQNDYKEQIYTHLSDEITVYKYTRKTEN